MNLSYFAYWKTTLTIHKTPGNHSRKLALPRSVELVILRICSTLNGPALLYGKTLALFTIPLKGVVSMTGLFSSLFLLLGLLNCKYKISSYSKSKEIINKLSDLVGKAYKNIISFTFPYICFYIFRIFVRSSTRLH